MVRTLFLSYEDAAAPPASAALNALDAFAVVYNAPQYLMSQTAPSIEPGWGYAEADRSTRVGKLGPFEALKRSAGRVAYRTTVVVYKQNINVMNV
ncbi:hypothetical protein CBS147326_5746 [Penicillium roqueforti]|nr:hypothetical protein CBS147326_5746 [Penicillium roqueforti]